MTARLTEQQYTTLLASRRGLAADAMERAGIERVSEEIKGQRALIRQSSKGPNKIEAAFANDILYWRKLRQDIVKYEYEAVTLRLANGVTFRPDWYVVEVRAFDSELNRIVFYEVKGEKRHGKVKARDDAAAKLKVAASTYPEFRFVLVWKDEQGTWQEQSVLP